MVEDFKREVSELRAELKAQSAKNDSDSSFHKEKGLPKKGYLSSYFHNFLVLKKK